MLDKYIQLGGGGDWGPDYVPIHQHTLTKIASSCYTPTSLVDVMSKLVPRPEGRYILLNALGAHEYWGFNMNGDAFPEWSLKGEDPPKTVQDIIDLKVKPKIPDFTVPYGNYGHETFVTNAKVYVGHANTDPTKAIGDVIASAYNDKMHRVELIVFVYTDRNPELVQRIDSNEPVPFSMGAKLRFDVCSVCLNIARTRAEYCEHLAGMLRQTLPDGRRVYSYNFFPRFFDISYVRVPADRSAWALKKVASLSQASIPHKMADKLAELVKKEMGSGQTMGTSPIDPKLVRLMTSRAVDAYKDRPEDPEMLRLVTNCKVEKALASLTAMGVVLKPQEVVKLSSRYPEIFTRSFSLDDVDPLIVRAADDIIKRTTTHNPYFTKRAGAHTVSKGSLDTDSAAFTQYRKYLKSIDFNKLAAWLDSSPVAQLTLQMDNFLYKVAGLNTEQTSIPLCLPTACLVYYLNSTIR